MNYSAYLKIPIKRLDKIRYYLIKYLIYFQAELCSWLVKTGVGKYSNERLCVNKRRDLFSLDMGGPYIIYSDPK